MDMHNAYKDGHTLIFNHIPKTSGTAIILSISKSVESERTLVGYDRWLFGSFINFDTIAPDIRKMIYFKSEQLDSSAQFVAGHFALSTTKAAYPDGQFVTFLREGRTRILSQWMYLRSIGPEALASWGDWGKRQMKAYAPLEQFLSDEVTASDFDNIVIRHLLWPHPLVRPDRFIDRADDQEILGVAYEKLASYAHIDVIESPAFVERLQAWLGRPFVYERANETIALAVSLRSPLYQEFTPLALERLDECSRLDNALWMHVASSYLGEEMASKLMMRALMTAVARYSNLMTIP